MIDHEPYEELISAKLTGDLSEIEEGRLESHLAGCARCRDTMTAFTEGRRLVAGMRHLPPPRDLDARVRTGIERGAFAQLPWWRRPAAIFTGVAGAAAVIAGALLGVTLLQPRPPEIGETTQPSPTAALSATPGPSESETPEPTLTPAPTPTQPPVAALPASYLALTGSIEAPVLDINDGETGAASVALPQPPGAPVGAAMAPDGEWIAYVTEEGLRGTYRFWLARTSDGDAVTIGQSEPPGGLSPFMEQLAWSPDGRQLAFARIAPGGESDVWIVDTDASSPVPEQLTAVGNAAVGSFDPDGRLWVSIAGDSPTSFRLRADSVTRERGLSDLAASADHVLEGFFQPLVSPDGTKAIAWTGVMSASSASSFVQAGFPWLLTDMSLADPTSDRVALFGDVQADRDAFRSAAITWGPNSNSIAVWETDWTGVSQGEASYPDRMRVYFGRANEAEPINATRVLDEADIPTDAARIEDVAIAPDGIHLALTIRYPLPGDSSPPRADLWLVTRNTGDVDDEVVAVPGTSLDAGWFGPAFYPR